MRTLTENIFVRLLIPLAAGILTAYYFSINIFLIACLLIVIFLLSIGFHYLNFNLQYKFQTYYGLLLLLLIYLCGYLLYASHEPDKIFHLQIKSGKYILVKIDDEPLKRERVTKIIGKIQGIQINDTLTPCEGRCMLFISNSDKTATLKYNDLLLCKNTLKLVERDPNPHAIDYQRILRNKGIYYSGFLNDAQYKITGHLNNFDIYEAALITRAYCLKNIKKYVRNSESASVCSSLLLGQRNDLSFELENAYASAGVIHILAVSGMHVGLIYLLLQFLLGISGVLKRKRLFSFFILVIGIWFFALVTGLTSSVTRASMMITLVAIGNFIQRPLFTLNILFGSAFIILCYQPNMLFDIGFQLSFTAVLGILILQPVLYEWLHTTNPILDGMMKIISVSIAAQAFTLPLIVFYFHQIPIHFVLANLIVVPVLSYVIYALLLLLLFSVIPAIAICIGSIINTVVDFINQTIFYIQSLPFALLQVRSFNLFMLILSFLLMASFTNYLYTRRIRFLNLSLAILIVLIGINTVLDLYKLSRYQLQIFKHDKGLVSALKNRSQAVILYPEKMNLRSGAFDHYIKQYLLYENVQEAIWLPVSDNNNVSITADWFTFSDKCLRTNACIIKPYDKRQEIYLKDTVIICSNDIHSTNKEYNIIANGPLLIPLPDDESSISYYGN